MRYFGLLRYFGLSRYFGLPRYSDLSRYFDKSKDTAFFLFRQEAGCSARAGIFVQSAIGMRQAEERQGNVRNKVSKSLHNIFQEIIIKKQI